MSKQGHNAFYFFMLDFKDKHGRKYPSLKDVADAAGPHWKNMNKDQRRVYEDRARAAKGALKASRLNSDKKPIDEIEEMENQEIEWKQQMKDDIQATLAIARRTNMLDSHLLFLVHVNSYCQHEHTKKYSPCEVAIAGFSLKDGVMTQNVYHAMIKPGSLPLGYAGIAQQHANETHQIELPKIGDTAEANEEEIYDEIIKFLSLHKKGGKFPPLYALEKNLQMVKSVFENWCDRFEKDIRPFQIYNLQCMFRILRNTVAGSDVWTSDTMSYQEIENDVYNYTEEIACEFHQMADVLIYCSRSIVIRSAFVICDHCCKDLNIQLIPGNHVPSNAKIAGAESFKPVRSSRKYMSSKYTSDSSVRDDSSDAETVMSLGRSSDWEESISSSSVDFPELGKSTTRSHTVSSERQLSQESRNNLGSYAGATSSNIGSSGFSKRPAALPFGITDQVNGMSLSQDSMDNDFPAIGVGRARNNNLGKFMRGKGRGHPFMKE